MGGESPGLIDSLGVKWEEDTDDSFNRDGRIEKKCFKRKDKTLYATKNISRGRTDEIAIVESSTIGVQCYIKKSMASKMKANYGGNGLKRTHQHIMKRTMRIEMCASEKKSSGRDTDT